MLAGNASSSVDVTVKWDGAPAIFAGTNPENGQFFVGTKGVFAKNAKINYTEEDIDRNHSGGLASKLKIALKELSKVDIQGVLQGDMMYSSEDIEKKTIDGEGYLTFQPNTIVYAVPEKSQLAAKILSSNMGIVWHTTYTGDTMEDMVASFGVASGAFRETSSVWQADASFKDQSGTVTMTKDETDQVTAVLSEAGKLFRRMDSGTLTMIAEDPKTAELVKTFNNKKVREGQSIKDPKRHTAELIAYIYDKLKAEVDKVKREDSKKNKQEQMDRYVGFLRKKSSEMVKIFVMQNLIVKAKKLIMKKLQSINN